MSNRVKVFADKLTQVVSRFDDWTNVLTGLGTSRDKKQLTQFAGNGKLTDQYCDELYHGDDMASRICDTLPEESLRQGFIFSAPASMENQEQLGEIDAVVSEAKEIEGAVMTGHEDLKTAQKVAEAAVWANVFGGSAILLGAIDGASAQKLNEPLDLSKIQALNHLNVIDKRYMTPLKWYDDPTLPKFGTPATYMISQYGSVVSASDMSRGGILEVHETRMCIFGGVRTSLLRRQENGGWEDGLLQRVHTVLRQFGSGWDTLEHLLTDANQGVYKIHGLIDALAANDQGVVTKRMQMIDMARSVIRSVILDAEMESFERTNFSWSGIKEPYELLMYRLAAAARLPVTVLMGRSPAGMNATGDSDFRALYDRVQAYQNEKIKPALDYITKIMLLAKNGPTGGQEPEQWFINFPSLYQMTPKEEAELRKMQAEADHIYITDGVVTQEEIALSRFTADGWSAETKIDIQARLLKEQEEPEEPEQIEVPVPVPMTEIPEAALPETQEAIDALNQ